MTRAEFDEFCAGLPATEHVVQWGGASVWKVGGRIFAVCSRWGAAGRDCVSFKCSDMAFEVLTQQPGIVPAPYLGRAKWVQLRGPDAMSDDDVRSHVAAAHGIVAAKLTRKLRAEIGL